MPELSYRVNGLVIGRQEASAATRDQIRDLQRDLRQLGYLRSGIDGRFGRMSEIAVKALQHDLLHNVGKSLQGDGSAPVRLIDYNRGRIMGVTGAVDEKLAACISDILDDDRYPKLPRSHDPKGENSRVLSTLKGLPPAEVPIPFLLGILKQESGLKHFNEPTKNDQDTFIVVGLDTNAVERHIITSRGYGVGQYTLFHHPPTKDEVSDFMLNVERNVLKAVGELVEKFETFVNGPTTGTRADDRIVEHGSGPLRLCKYGAGDPRYMSDCRQCMTDAGQEDIREGITVVYEGSGYAYTPTEYYQRASYGSVPVRRNVGCDWPYAVRRYNGAGMNSYHYQAIVLKNVLAQ